MFVGLDNFLDMANAYQLFTSFGLTHKLCQAWQQEHERCVLHKKSHSHLEADNAKNKFLVDCNTLLAFCLEHILDSCEGGGVIEAK